jgi:tRNA U38,U39,U40 pseudouridine synthase TruA
VAQFFTDKELDLATLPHQINQLLPQDVCVHQAARTAADFNASFSACGKTCGPLHTPQPALRPALGPSPFPSPHTTNRAWVVRCSSCLQAVQGQAGARAWTRTLTLHGAAAGTTT